MAANFPRFSSLGPGQFRSVWFGQRVSEIKEEIEQSRDLVQWQFLTSIVIMITIIYLLIRGLDSIWVLMFILPIIAIGGASLQHSLILYRLYIHAYVMPALCEAFGRLRYSVGIAPDLCFQRLVNTGLLPRHHHHRIDDVFFGDYRGHQLTLASVNLLHCIDDNPTLDNGDRSVQTIVMAIRWPTEPISLPSNDLSSILEGESRLKMVWSDGYLMMSLTCAETPFNLGGLFEPPDQVVHRLAEVAGIIQMPSNIIDYLLDDHQSRSATLTQ